MRTFKFRVYIPEHGMFRHFGLNDFDYSDRYLHQHNIPVQQFTGVKDTDNVDVYEGDLVEFVYANQPDIEDSKGVYEVFYSEKDSAYYLRVHKKNWLDTSFVTERDAKAKTIDANCPAQSLTELPLSQFKICRVIGNIFENTELLK
jgi:uncharacterized phage protein (TIGR01671 family)